MKREKILAIDVGGTYIKYALWDGELGEVKEVPTPKDSLESFLKTIKSLIDEVGNIEGIGFSFPGFIDNKTGMKYLGGSLEYIDNTNIIELIRDEFGLKAAIDNDSKSATLAEMKLGVLKDVKSAVTLILGTGVGGTVVADGKIVRGKHLLAGEFSFLNMDYHNMIAPENWAGSLCGKSGLSDCVYEKTGLEGLDGREIFQLIHDGNEKVIEGLKEFCRRVCWMIYNLSLITDPEVFIIGGGISAQPLLIETINEMLDELYSRLVISLEKPRVITCKFRSKANLIGAALNYEEYYSKK